MKFVYYSHDDSDILNDLIYKSKWNVIKELYTSTALLTFFNAQLFFFSTSHMSMDLY